MLIRLAEALDVPLRDRNALLLEAGFAPAYPETRFDDPALGPVRRALERVLDGHLPYPAVVTDRRGDLLAANAAFDALVGGCRARTPRAARQRRAPAHAPRGPRLPNSQLRRVGPTCRRRAGAAATTTSRLKLAAFLPDHVPTPDHRGHAVPLQLTTPLGRAHAPDDTRALRHGPRRHRRGAVPESFLPADEATERLLHAASSMPS